MIPPRQFLQTATDARNSVRELIQTMFAAELLFPSRCLWIISPWLRDVPVLDNTTGSFLALCPDFPIAEVRLSLVLQELLTRGTQIVIATRPDFGNRQVMLIAATLWPWNFPLPLSDVLFSCAPRAR